MTDAVRYEGEALARIRASDAEWIASLRSADRAAQTARLDALRALEAALVDGRTLEYPPGTTAHDIVTGGVLPSNVSSSKGRVIVISETVRVADAVAESRTR